MFKQNESLAELFVNLALFTVAPLLVGLYTPKLPSYIELRRMKKGVRLNLKGLRHWYTYHTNKRVHAPGREHPCLLSRVI